MNNKPVRVTVPASVRELYITFSQHPPTKVADKPPLAAFIRQCCKMVATARTPRKDVYRRYVAWAARNSLRKLGKTEFGRQLHQALPQLRDCKIPIGDRRVNGYQGLRLS